MKSQKDADIWSQMFILSHLNSELRIVPLGSGGKSTLPQLRQREFQIFNVYFSGGSGGMPPVLPTILNSARRV